MHDGMQKMFYSFTNTLLYEGVIGGNDIRGRIEEIPESRVRFHLK